MKRTIQVDDDGTLVIPADLLSGLPPHSTYMVEVHGKVLTVSPENHSDTRSRGNDRQARTDAFRRWAERPRPPAPAIPDDALRREALYD